MTEPNNFTVAGYVPISCNLHSEYELAILRCQWLRLVWSDENSARNTIHDQIALPLDLKTVSGEEFLMCRTKDSVTRNIRLDRVQRVYPA